MRRVVLLALATMLASVPGSYSSNVELVRFSHKGVVGQALWSEAGADFQPTINDVCSRFKRHNAYDACAATLREAILAADLKLWNARDGKELTWDQRPPRLMPAHLESNFTLGGGIQHLRSYTDQSQEGCDIHRPYSSEEITELVETARARRYGPSYPHVDLNIFQCRCTFAAAAAPPFLSTLIPPQ